MIWRHWRQLQVDFGWSMPMITAPSHENFRPIGSCLEPIR